MRYRIKFLNGAIYEFHRSFDEPSEGYHPKGLLGNHQIRQFFRRCIGFSSKSPDGYTDGLTIMQYLLGLNLSEKALEERFVEAVEWNQIFIYSNQEPPLLPMIQKAKQVSLDSLAYKAIDSVADEPEAKQKTLELELFYDDLEKTPAGKTPFKITFSNDECIAGVLDEKGCATIPNAPDLPAQVTFGDEAAFNEAANSIIGAYQQLAFVLDDAAKQIGKHMLAVARSQPKAEEPPADIKEAFKQAVEKELAKYKAKAEEYDQKTFLQKTWEQAKSVTTGVKKGFSEYVPDLGEFGDLMDAVDLDVTDLVDAIATGNVDELETKFQAWQRDNKGFAKASEAMEMLILLLSDEMRRAES
ncbi:hypothetical protein H0A36_27520 [Endozoicomonas sp. SM1973]|uniref:Uncharacterized protein n=1 Tax=Spartinivicinus marinus TaxID=2994442 RepID=A0A853IPE5_9GAMM|nr:hypothetical protein [Spartinivicinus marinus]MCX4030502.1 hypothetical protein [Spartinivicinus marinus]NYZ69766.1 hypothetical protein [Spartinivicinus marinus]